MQKWMLATVVPVVLLIGTVLGNVVYGAVKKEKQEITAAFATVQAALMLAAACFDLLPAALEYAHWEMVIAGVVIGALFLFSAVLYKVNQQNTMLIWQLFMGMATGAAGMLSMELGRKILIAFFLCAFLQGAAYGGKKIRILIQFVFASFGCFVGQAAGSYLVELSGLCLALGSGALLISSCRTLLPDKKKCKQSDAGSTVLGLVLGLVLSLL